MFTTSVHSDSAFRKDELAAGRTLISIVVLNLANRVYLHQPSVLTSIGSLDLYEDYVFQLNQLARFNTDIKLEDRGSTEPARL